MEERIGDKDHDIWKNYKEHHFFLAVGENEDGSSTYNVKILCPDGTRREIQSQEKFNSPEKAQTAGRQMARQWIDDQTKS